MKELFPDGKLPALDVLKAHLLKEGRVEKVRPRGRMEWVVCSIDLCARAQVCDFCEGVSER